MGRVFDSAFARLYEQWLNSPEGISLDRLSTELIMRLLQPKRGERVLDIGCGTGNHLLIFYRIGLDVTGLDASSYMLDIARSRLGHRAALELGRAEDLPFEDNEFDITTLILTLEFLDDPLAALQEAGRVTRDRIFVGVLNSLSIGCILKKLAALFQHSIFRGLHTFTLWELSGLVRRSYGEAPIKWGSVQMLPFLPIRHEEGFERSSLLQSQPFGTFLGLACTMTYTLKTRYIGVLEKSKKGADSIARSARF
ncbi:MAG: methyltransferase domain-containing protein [Deltaproteobacteria bacterium]|nr:methyltransferase domain-containing protein [Deltaproteobacteria bacterium]